MECQNESHNFIILSIDKTNTGKIKNMIQGDTNL